MENEWCELAERAWLLLRSARDAMVPHVVDPSMPILYFGDAERYLNSPLRVVTVGLNPSLLEFPSDDPWRRFPECERIAGDAVEMDQYLASLNRYFMTAPYKAWFRPSFEPLLSGLGATFWPGAGSAALHTDVCSPLATNPTWSRLSPAGRAALADGVDLWHDLLLVLRPDVILMSVARGYLNGLGFSGSDWFTVHRVVRDNPYDFLARRVRLGADETLLVWGRAANTPFGTVAATDKIEAGRAIKAKLRD